MPLLAVDDREPLATVEESPAFACDVAWIAKRDGTFFVVVDNSIQRTVAPGPWEVSSLCVSSRE
jgi:hypothetical protein